MASEDISSGSWDSALPIDISDQDIYEAMKDIPGYLDITPGDLKELFRFAYTHAVERIAGSVRARDIMTTPVHAVLRSAPLDQVAQLMADAQISGVPVLDDEKKVIGVISEKDFLSRMGAQDAVHVMSLIAACLKGKPCLTAPVRRQTAEEIMSSPAITVGEEMTLFMIMELFSTKSINRVPVVNADNMLRGIISRADIIRAPVLKRKTP